MLVRIPPSKISGAVSAIPSKSVAHRMFICAALGTSDVFIQCSSISQDIAATIGCLNALGADIQHTDGGYNVSPIKAAVPNAVLDCGESGTTLRFMLPIVAALGCGASLVRHGRLASRPIGELLSELVRMGAEISENGSTISVYGRLRAGCYSIRGDISSQYISGLLLALPLLEEDSSLSIKGALESRPYVELTKSVQSKFGIAYSLDSPVIDIKSTGYCANSSILKVEGDWSNSAFWLTAGAMRGSITVTDLDISSAQGDRQILDILISMGADVSISCSSVTVSHRRLSAADIDARHIPDLVPVLSVLASAAEGSTNIHSAQRLRLKESDRLTSITAMLSALGGDIAERADGLLIAGRNMLTGGTVGSFNDHRIVMSAAIASVVAEGDIFIEGAEAVSKSYPQFFDDFCKLGGSIIL